MKYLDTKTNKEFDSFRGEIINWIDSEIDTMDFFNWIETFTDCDPMGSAEQLSDEQLAECWNDLSETWPSPSGIQPKIKVFS